MIEEIAPELLCSGVGSEPDGRTGLIVGTVPHTFRNGFGVCPVCRLSVLLADDGKVGDHKPV